MFQSATIKLTGWYLAILMTISLTFSLVIYQINFNELNTRLENFQQSAVEIAPGIFIKTTASENLDLSRNLQSAEAARQLLWSLVWTNLTVLVLGGMASYYFAKKTLEPIQKAHEAQSQFTSDASHELRTPLAVMKTEIEASLLDKDLSAEEAREFLQSSLEEVNSLIKLSETLLELSRIDSQNIDKEKINLAELAKERLSYTPERVKHIEYIGPKIANVYGNRVALAEVIDVLANNALLYNKNNQKIEAKVVNHRSSVTFEIKNYSEKLTDNQINRIFDRFYRVDKSRTHKTDRGYGLGLSIAKKIIDAHNGTIQAKHKADKTTLSFTLSQHKK